jgi:hypothetical protein
MQITQGNSRLLVVRSKIDTLTRGPSFNHNLCYKLSQPYFGQVWGWSATLGKSEDLESNWQFDSRPLKVGNRPLPDLRIESAIRRWKYLGEGYKFGSDLVAIRLCSRELWALKVPGLHPGQFRDNFGTLTWESREKVTFGRGCHGESQSIL